MLMAIMAGALLQVQAPLAARPDTLHPVHDALHYDITVVLDDSSRYVLGEVETRWRVGGPQPVEVALDSTYKVIRVAMDGKPNTRVSRTLWGRPTGLVVLPHEKAVGDTLTTRIRYRGEAIDGLILRPNAHGLHTAFADNWPDRAHRWFPSQDHPSDKASVDLHVQVPLAWQVIANGTLLKVDTLARASHVWNYRLAEPIPTYSMVLGAAPFARTVLPPAQCAVACVPVEVWSFREDSAYAAQAFARAPEILDFLATIGGPFPYPQLRHVQSSTHFGGMENATAIFYDETMYTGRRLPESIIAHETAHQWFGDAVTEADWHHVWLSEGFATYMAALWERHAHGDSAFRATMAAAATAVREGTVADRPILDPAATDLLGLLNTNAYQKGSWVLHSLRGVVGDSAFFRGIRTYVDTYRHGNALSSDVATVMEQASGRPLDWFFTQMLTQPRWPELAVSWTWAAGKLTLVVRQTRAADVGTWTLPKLGVAIDGAVRTIDVQGAETRVVLRAARKPKAITIDPDGWWLLTATVQEGR